MRLNSSIIRFYKLAYNSPKKFIFVPLIVYWIILFILTTIPSKSMPAFAVSDKIKHFLAYMILTVLLRLALHFYSLIKKKVKMELLVVISIIVFYGVFDELHQYFIPGRSCELLDLTANYIGLIVGIILATYFIKVGSERAILGQEGN